MLNDKIYNQLLAITHTENISVEDSTLRIAEQTNYKTNQKIIAIISPENIDSLRECLKILNTNKIPVYTISRGKNWGYGSKVPILTDSVLIDLSKLNKILDYNEKLGFVTIEPGVTFQQLFDFLRENNSNLIISITGGSKDSSLIGNALDRGIGTGLYADRFSSVCNLEVLLSNGEVINTGFGRFGDNVISKVYRWGLGPSLDGLFSQSNLGIVTKMTMWLMPIPNNFQLLFYKVINQNNLPRLIDALQELSIQGLVRPTITIYNDFRIVSSLKQYPWNQCNPQIDSPESVMKLLKEDIGINDLIGSWNGEISIRSANSEHGYIQYNIIKEAIKPYVSDITLVEINKEDILNKLRAHYYNNFKDPEKNIIKSFLLGKYIGIPNDLAIKQTYWRKKTPIPLNMNPDKDKCGIIWICPIVPFTGADIELAIKIIQQTIEKYFFEPSISLQCMSERAINIIASISWDRESEQDEKNSSICYEEVNELLNKNGYYAYRDTTLSMKLKQNQNVDNSYNHLMQRIKNTFDPANILSPGRYI